MSDYCVFCAIVYGREPATVIREWPDALAIVPLRPCTPGHTLVIPHAHVRDFSADPVVTATVAARLAELAQDMPDANMIFNKGENATQTQFHLHGHVVPRHAGDGLPLPWSHQHD